MNEASGIRLGTVLLLACCGGMLVLMCREIQRKFAWLGWIGTEPLTADRTGILPGPYAFAFSVCHYRLQADFFGWHRESLHQFHQHHREESFKVYHCRRFDQPVVYGHQPYGTSTDIRR